ncbi:hypothetical protein AL051_00015 [Pseudomonas amygdali pv. dendropanacis]|nr:hypothetical protein AL051_00015 [Pseudomonas amygdali pv. dendropanacis]
MDGQGILQTNTDGSLICFECFQDSETNLDWQYSSELAITNSRNVILTKLFEIAKNRDREISRQPFMKDALIELNNKLSTNRELDEHAFNIIPDVISELFEFHGMENKHLPVLSNCGEEIKTKTKDQIKFEIDRNEHNIDESDIDMVLRIFAKPFGCFHSATTLNAIVQAWAKSLKHKGGARINKVNVKVANRNVHSILKAKNFEEQEKLIAYYTL